MKKLVLPGIIILIVILLIGGVMGVCKAIFTNRFEAEIAAIKAKGEPLTPADLAGKPIPASEDAGPIYDQIHQKTATRNFKNDSKVIDKVIGLRGAPMDAATRQNLARALAHSQPLLDLTAEAVSKPHYRMRIDWSTGSIDFPQIAELRNMCRLLSAKSLLSAQSGDMPGAVGDITMQFRIAVQLEEGGTLIAQLVRVALAAIAAKSVTDTARHGEFSEAQARQIYEVVGTIDIAQGFRQGWLGERVLFLTLDPTAVAGAATTSGGVSPGQVVSVPFNALYTNTAFKGDQAEYLRFIASQLDAITLSYPEAKARGLLNDPNLPIYALFSKMMTPVFVSGGFRRFDAEERLARTRVFLALQAYKDRFGAYPASIQELKSKLGWKLPVDPFSAKDFIYKRQAKGFILYSVGPDMKDDGGRPVPNNRPDLDSKGDIVLKWDK